MPKREKILLLVSAALAIASLLLVLYFPKNPYFALPLFLRVIFYGCAAIPFLLLARFRQNIRIALLLFWIIVAVFIVLLLLFLIAQGVFFK